MDLTKFYKNIQFKAVEMGNNTFPKYKAFVRLLHLLSHCKSMSPKHLL